MVQLKKRLERANTNKLDVLLVIIILIVNTLFLVDNLSNEQSKYANIYYNGELYAKMELDKDASFELYSEYGNGIVEVTVKRGKVAITKETSPNNICSKQGYVNVDIVPLICLPNRVEVRGDGQDTDKLDEVIR